MPIIGPVNQPYPKPTWAPLIQAKGDWANDWMLVPELQLVEATVCAAGQGLDTCTIQRRYGQVKLPWQTAFSTKRPWTAGAGIWVRVLLAGESGYQQAWIGRIAGDARQVFGADVGPAGIQTFECHGPLRILQRIAVSTSFWLDGVNPAKENGWVPPMNDRSGDRSSRIVGNKAQGRSLTDPSYVYGGTEMWTNFDYAEYLLARFVDESADGGPRWTLSGQTEVLKALQDVIQWPTSQTVEAMLRELIPKRLGVDFTIRASDDGFEVFVYALSGQSYSFGGYTLPANPQTVEIDSSQTADCQKTCVIASSDQQYGRIRVLGRRIVVCCTLATENGVQTVAAGTLVQRWEQTLQDEYDAGGDGDLVEDKDAFRARDKFRTVYQAFGAEEDIALDALHAVPLLDAAGALVDGSAEYQTESRHTLSWLPLLEGFDYTEDPAEDLNPEGHEPEFRKPTVWFRATAPTWIPLYDRAWFPADGHGVSVSAAREDWGVLLSCNPNHLVAHGTFPTAGEPRTSVIPYFDFRAMVATIAFESDARLCLTHDVVADWKPSDGVLDIDVDADFWYLAPNTVVDVEENPDPTVQGQRLAWSPPTPVILRDDSERLRQAMAGAIARYQAERARAELVLHGLFPWGQLVGQILNFIEEGGVRQTVEAPITSVSWSMPQGDKGEPTTTIKAGYAQ